MSHNTVRVKEQMINIKVINHLDEEIGKISDVVLYKISAQVAYVIVDSGSFLGMNSKLFAVPWNALHFNTNKDCYVVTIEKSKLKTAPSIDKDYWPDSVPEHYR